MDDEQPPTGMSGSLSVVRAAGVLALFVAAVAILVAVGTRPSVSGAPSSAQTTVPTTTPTTTPGAGGSTTTTAPAATTTTTTTHHGKKGSGSTTTTTTVPPSTVSVVVANATSTNGLAAHYSTVIGAGGWSMKAPIDAATSEATSAVYYAPGFQPEAAAIASSIGVKSTQVLPVSSATPVSATSGLDVIVVIGQDLASTTTTTTASS